jgi:hypothetical protein
VEAFPLRAIELESDRALAIAEGLIFQSDKIPAEFQLLKLIVTLIETYESKRYPMECRRDGIAQDAQKSLAEFRSGQLKPQSAAEAITELREFLATDTADD